jgi:hypothetical protein
VQSTLKGEANETRHESPTAADGDPGRELPPCLDEDSLRHQVFFESLMLREPRKQVVDLLSEIGVVGPARLSGLR